MDFFKTLENSGIKYNENQKMAIAHTDGPILIAAGPGSGKTSVIAAKCAYLIKKANVDPSSILVITFTRAAATEMQHRFKNFPSIQEKYSKQVDFGTFHSTFYRIINSYYGTRIKVLDQNKARDIIKASLKSINEPYDDDLVLNILNDISFVRTTFSSETYHPEQLSRSKFIYILKQYESQKKSLKCIDFDDMMLICKRLLESEPELLSRWRHKYKYFLVDEFQDSSSMQFDIVKLLAEPLNNICVVGDDDQSIYSFRGAIPDCLRNFESYYSNCTTVTLDINYRSTKNIVDFSEKVISKNSSRKEKHMKSVSGYGSDPIILFPPDENSEASFIADVIEEMKSKGYKYSDFAVLYRVNVQSRAIMDVLIDRNIPFNIRDSISNFFEHWVCRDITCYLKLSLDIMDNKSFTQIVNRPLRYIPKNLYNNNSIFNTAIAPLSSNQKIGKSDWINNMIDISGLESYQIEKLYKMYDDIKSISNMSPSQAIAYIKSSIDYNGYIKKYCSDMDIKPDELFDILDEYEEAAAQFSTLVSFLSHIHEVSDMLKDFNKNLVYKKDSVTLSTIHGAKGLEFECVFVTGLVEGILPHKKSLSTVDEIEEERRLYYVGVTRSKHYLYICSYKKHHGDSCQTSRFLDEQIPKIDNEQYNKKLMPGTLICHSLFGTGRIKKVQKGIAEVNFISYGKKLIDIETCIKNKLIEFSEKFH